MNYRISSWYLDENVEEAASSDEHRFSIALNVDKDNDIFSSSNVINAFCNENKKIKIKLFKPYRSIILVLNSA